MCQAIWNRDTTSQLFSISEEALRPGPTSNAGALSVDANAKDTLFSTPTEDTVASELGGLQLTEPSLWALRGCDSLPLSVSPAAPVHRPHLTRQGGRHGHLESHGHGGLEVTSTAG